MVPIVIMVATVMVVKLVLVNTVVTGRGEHGGHGGQDRDRDGTGRDGTGQNWHLNMTFQVTCYWQLSQFLSWL